MIPEIEKVASLPSSVSLAEIRSDRFDQFLAYWDSLRGAAFAPGWKQFELWALPPAIIPYITVVDVHRDPLDFVCRFFGTGQTNRKGIDWTGKSLQSFPVQRGPSAFDEYRWVVDNKRPLTISDMVVFENAYSNRVPFEQHSLRLPLSDDGQEVTQIVSLAIWDKK